MRVPEIDSLFDDLGTRLEQFSSHQPHLIRRAELADAFANVGEFERIVEKYRELDDPTGDCPHCFQA